MESPYEELHRLPVKLLISINPPHFLADRFVELFTDKIIYICSTFPVSITTQHIGPDLPPTFSHFF